MKVGIIGGGASGLVAAIYAAASGNEVTILEKNNVCGKKILVTGNGKCNYFNDDMDLKHYYSFNKDFLDRIITKENKEEILSLFARIGIVPKIKNGYYYPSSNQAISVRDALLLESELFEVKVINDFLVEEIVKEDKFVVNPNSESLYFDKIILCTGSKAMPLSGSDGMGYDLAQAFGHSLIKPCPGLVGLCGAEKYFKDWDGVRCDAKISLFENGEFIKEESGEAQLTDEGISGVCTFNLSSLATRSLDKGSEVELFINFLPWLNSISDTLDFLENRSVEVTGRTLFQFFEGLFNYKLIKVLLNKADINPEKYYDELNKKEKYALAKTLSKFNLKITGTKSFDRAQICSGGIPLTEINPCTMESLKTRGLYLCGELLDVNGDCGGYNLGFAWISGMIAGKGINDD